MKYKENKVLRQFSEANEEEITIMAKNMAQEVMIPKFEKVEPTLVFDLNTGKFRLEDQTKKENIERHEK